MKKSILVICFLLTLDNVYAGIPPLEKLITKEVSSIFPEEKGVVSYRITSTVPLKAGGKVAYGIQTHNGFDVFKSTFTAVVKSDELVQFTHSFIPNLEQLIVTTDFSLRPSDALAALGKTVNIAPTDEIKPIGNGYYELNNITLSDETISIQKMWVVVGAVALPAYNVSLYEKDHQHWYNTRIDATTGKRLNYNDWVVQCSGFFETEASPYLPYAPMQQSTSATAQSASSASYTVFDRPLESPIHGSRTVAIDPHDSSASPFGWHDTNGADGAEFTITRGNNVYASEDKNDDNIPGTSPDGGSTLTFDHPFDINQSAALFTDAAITNLFYWNNLMHDVWWHYGFDEQSGNFQQNNYGNGGRAQDFVNADAQDGSGTNNANMATPPDGINPRMQMFLWNAAGVGDYFMVNSPGGISGKYVSNRAGFGPPLSSVPITGDLVLVEDNSAEPNKGCNALTNAAAISGNIALVERRDCNFTVKVKNAQNAGARAVVIYSDDNQAPILMGGTDNTVTIPAILVTNASGITLLNAMRTQTINVSIYDSSNLTPSTFDSDFDNGIIAHEYGHGISNRLTGGPAASGCLSNEEQMGEGWSDFFGLVMTHAPGDLSTRSRGIGTYVRDQPTSGGGIRPFPYSTDMGTSPYTYDDVKRFSVPHGVGSVWCSMLWDLYWAMIDKHGYDSDIYRGTGGNNMAMQLVIDGLKLQKCNPGFEDGRDAILLADRLNNNGVNELLIWEVFARRGLGHDATQGSSDSRADGSEAFNIPPYLLNALVLTKRAELEVINKNELVYTLVARNRTTETVRGILLLDTLNTELILDESSLNCGIFQDGIVSISLDSIAAGDSFKCSFRVTPSLEQASTIQLQDEITPETKGAWEISQTSGSDDFNQVTTNTYSGSHAWFVVNEDVQSDYLLSRSLDLTGMSKPLFRFHHWYNTEDTWDGAVVEVRSIGGMWMDAADLFLINGYNGIIQSNPASPISGRAAFTGNSAGYIQSGLDLTSFAGQEIEVRFRMASDGAASALGWFIDEIDLVDARFVDNSVTATYLPEGKVSAEVTTLVITDEETNNVIELENGVSLTIYPNPANDFITLKTTSPNKISYTLTSSLGQAMMKGEGFTQININTTALADAMYVIEIEIDGERTAQKVLVKH